MRRRYVVLGAGYTGSRVALRLRARGLEVVETHRGVFDTARRETVPRFEEGDRVLHSIPVRAMPLLGQALAGRAARLVYLSTTGVYSGAHIVDENTPAAPRTPREIWRFEEERDVLEGPWAALVLRPAAIYGPGRGVHVSIREGRHRILGDGSNFISRIHVDDLARIAEAALDCDVIGAYPVGDDEPCAARTISDFAASLIGFEAPAPGGDLPAGDTRSANRRVDGRAIRRLLGVELRYPSYRTGLPAALEEERRRASVAESAAAPG
jgi:nucleoside-diphosphate-sugar epimerase